MARGPHTEALGSRCSLPSYPILNFEERMGWGGARTKRSVENIPAVGDVVRDSLVENIGWLRWVAGCGI